MVQLQQRKVSYIQSQSKFQKNSIYCFVAIDDQGITSSVVTRAYNYVPKRISYSQASNSLTDYLVSNGKFENNYGEFENGDVGYLEYKR